jgi:hypothetical protein
MNGKKIIEWIGYIWSMSQMSRLSRQFYNTNSENWREGQIKDLLWISIYISKKKYIVLDIYIFYYGIKNECKFQKI